MSEWTLDTLKEHFEALRDADREALVHALDAANKALDVLAKKYDADKAAANEWRGTINDILAQGRGARLGIKELVAYVVGVVGIIAGIMTFIYRK
jgi:hypothetical protein